MAILLRQNQPNSNLGTAEYVFDLTERGPADEYGYHAVDNVASIYDLWATVLHLMGLRHTDLTFRHGGRDLRLTDVHGRVLHDVVVG